MSDPLLEPPVPRRYVASIRALDRSGSLTAVAEVVSSRGVSIESFSTRDFRQGTAVMTVVFTTNERLQRLIERTLRRLAVVSEVLVLPADDPRVLAAGVVHAPGRRILPPPGAAVAWSGDTALDQPLMVEGPLAEVEKVMDLARAEGADAVSFVLLRPTDA